MRDFHQTDPTIVGVSTVFERICSQYQPISLHRSLFMPLKNIRKPLFSDVFGRYRKTRIV